MKPLLIGIDGPDGAGKSTLVNGLRDHIESTGLTVDVVHVIKHSKPGALYYQDYVSGKLDPIREACGMLYSVMDSIHSAIRDAEEAATDVVIFDRTLFSTLCYQVYVNGYYWFEPVLKQCFSQPDFPIIHTYLLDVDPEVATQRMKLRGNLDAIESRGVEYQERINRAYRRAAHEHQHLLGRKVVGGESTMLNVGLLTPEQVVSCIASMVQPMLDKQLALVESL